MLIRLHYMRCWNMVGLLRRLARKCCLGAAIIIDGHLN